MPKFKAKPFNKQIMMATFAAIIAMVLPPQQKLALAQSNNSKELQQLEKERAARENRVTILETTKTKANNEILALQQKLVEAAQNQKNAEINAEKSESRLKNLRLAEQQATQDFQSKKTALENIVIALIGIEKNRPPPLAVQPKNATEAARVAILMRIIAPQLNAKARDIATQIGNLKKVRQDLLMGNEEYRIATENLLNSRKTTAILIAERQKFIAQLSQDADRERDIIAQIAQKASGLRDLIQKIGSAIPKMGGAISEPSLARGFAKAQGRILLPVNGQLVEKFGDKVAEGGNSNGIKIRTQNSAQIISPYDGKIEFSAPFRAYGRVLIINVGDSYRIVLAGLGETFVQAGQEVLAGEPIGEMSQDTRIVPDLYMEIRNKDATLDPMMWLNKANGG